MHAQVHRNIFFIATFLIAITLPLTDFLDVKVNSIAIIILFANWLFEGNFFQKISKLKSNKLTLLFLFPFFLNVIGLFNSDNLNNGVRYLVLNLSLFLMPIVYSTSNVLTRKQMNYIFVGFLASLLLCSLYIFKDGFVYTFGDLYNPHHVTLQKREIIGRVYASIYITFASFILYLRIFNQKKIFSTTNLAIALVSCYIVYINGILIVKTTILSSFVIVFCLLSIYFLRNNRLPYFFFMIIFTLFGLSTLYFVNPKVSTAVQKIIRSEPIEVTGSGVRFEMNSFSTRTSIWGAALDLLGENSNWLIGVGTGDVANALQTKYKEKGLPDDLYQDVHNEYLQTFLRNGILGLITLLMCLISPLIRSLREGNYLYISFILLTFLCLFTESWFSRQVGIVFYAFFNSLLAFSMHEKEEKELII